VTKSAPGALAAPGGGYYALDNDPFTWKVTVENTASVAIADSVAVTDTLPPNWSYDTGSTTIVPPTGPDTDPTVTVNAGGDVLTWSGLGTLNPGQSLTITYTATAGGVTVDHQQHRELRVPQLRPMPPPTTKPGLG